MVKSGYGSIIVSLVLAVNFLAAGCSARAEKQMITEGAPSGQLILIKTGQRVTVTGCTKLKKEVDAWNIAHPDDIKEYPC